MTITETPVNAVTAITDDPAFQRDLLHAIRGAADLPADTAMEVRSAVNRMLASAPDYALRTAPYPNDYGACIMCGAAKGQMCDTISEPGTPRQVPHGQRARLPYGPQGDFCAVRDEPNYGERPKVISNSETGRG